MKLNLLSDLHLRQGSLPLPRNDADVVVLAGDIDRPAEALAWARGFDKPVIYVPGNHEHYGDTVESTLAALRDEADGTGVHVLDRDVVVIGGVRFLGTTLWTDFRLGGDGDARAAAVRDAVRLIRDFSRIRRGAGSDAAFTPDDAAALFEQDARWLRRMLATACDGPTVVITHHAPSLRSIHPRFAGSPLNACFVSDAEDLLDGGRAALWIHGHTHDSFDYVVNGTRVVCNPRGYARNGVNENPAFDPDLCIDVH
jgi:predicted phosphodiesterase